MRLPTISSSTIRVTSYIRKVMTEFADYIKQETLAEQLLEKAPEPGAFTESHKLGEHKVSLSVKRLD